MFSDGSSIAAATEDTDHYIAQLAKQVGAKSLLNKKTLVDIMNKHYTFPNQFRVIIWRYLMRLPMNEDAYTLLASQPLHPSVRLLPNTLPIRYSVISNRLVRLLSALTYWHPPLAECDWLPALVFPFLRIFERDSLVSFEFVATILCNWCQEWLHFIPNPPVTVLSRIDRICKDNGGEAPLSVAWPALRSFFGEVATTEAALMLFDNILTSKPVFLEYLVASFALMPGEKVVQITNIIPFLEKAKQLYQKDYMNNPNHTSFHPLPVGHYPVLPVIKKEPRWRDKEIERIKEEAEAFKEREELADEIEKESARIERQRKNWMAERAVLREIEEEQMEEFRRREQEILLKENQKEEITLRIRRERLRNRRIEEENAINEWRADCERVQNEMRNVVETRRASWARWISIKEDAANLAQEEVDLELELLGKRNNTHQAETQRHRELMANAAQAEQNILNQAMKRNREIEEEKVKLKKKLDDARIEQNFNFMVIHKNTVV